jgi:hypothetical protein
MTNQLLTEAEALPDLDEYAGMSAFDIAHAVIYWPEGSEDQQRALAALRQRAPGIGHNRPPLADALTEELAPRWARAKHLIARAGESKILKGDEESAEKVVDLVRMLKEEQDDAKQARLARNKPYRDGWHLVNRTYEPLEVQMAIVVDGLNAMLTEWHNDKKAEVEAERRRLVEEARKRQEEADAARAALPKMKGVDPAAEIDALRKADEAERLQRRAEAIRHEPTRSQLGQTTRRRQIRFVVEDFNVRLRGILKSARRSQVEKLVADITEHELRDLGVAAVEAGVSMPGVRAWVEEGGVSVRR